MDLDMERDVNLLGALTYDLRVMSQYLEPVQFVRWSMKISETDEQWL